MEEALRDLESAEDKVVRIMEIAAKVTGALADPNAAKAQEELARDAEEYVELVKLPAGSHDTLRIVFQPTRHTASKEGTPGNI